MKPIVYNMEGQLKDTAGTALEEQPGDGEDESRGDQEQEQEQEQEQGEDDAVDDEEEEMRRALEDMDDGKAKGTSASAQLAAAEAAAELPYTFDACPTTVSELLTLLGGWSPARRRRPLFFPFATPSDRVPISQYLAERVPGGLRRSAVGVHAFLLSF